LAKGVALEDVTFTIEAGRSVALVGPAGSGKTAVLRLIVGLIRPDAGTISVFGHETVSDRASLQAVTGYVPQRLGLSLDLTVLEHLRLHGDLRNVAVEARRERIDRLLRSTGLDRHRSCRAGSLAHGDRQKLALACALLGKPRLLILDEPAAELDPASHRELLRIARALPAEGTTVMWATSSLEEAEQFDQAVILVDGRVVADGAPAALCASLGGRARAIRAVGPARRTLASRLGSIPSICDVRIEPDRVRFLLEAPQADAEENSLADLGPSETVAPRLEDLLLAGHHGDRRPREALPSSGCPVAAGGPAIVAARLSRRFGITEAVSGVDLVVNGGELFGIVGAPRVGKTTLLRMICGLLRPSEGTVNVAGCDLRAAPDSARRRIGYMSQQFSLYGELSAVQNLRFFARAYGVGRRRCTEQIARRLNEFDLMQVADARAGELPPGLQQRLSLAVSVVHEPEIVILDEPTAGLDPLTRRAIWRRIEALTASGLTVVVASRSIADAAPCDRLLRLDRGRALASGRPDEVVACIAGERTESRATEAAMDPRDVDRVPGEAA
jgi:ABC-2 type transport system ATP-binding protein